MTNNPALSALILSMIAGISTMAALFLMYVPKKHHEKMRFVSTSFSAGVMIYISLGELMPDCVNVLTAEFDILGAIYAVLFFIGGYIIVSLMDIGLDKLVFSHSIRENSSTGILNMLALTVHNFPEGMATFAAGVEDITLGISIAISIALHNIPEGMSIISSVYNGGENKKKASLYVFIASMAEPLGALMAYLFLYEYMSSIFMAGIFAVISGIMVYICLNELFVDAIQSGKKGFGMYAFWGMCFMYLVQCI